MRRIVLISALACGLAGLFVVRPSGASDPACAASLARLSQLKSEVAADAALTRLTESIAQASQPDAAQIAQAEDAALETAARAAEAVVAQAPAAIQGLRAARATAVADRIASGAGEFQRAFATFRQRIWPERTPPPVRTSAAPGPGAFSRPTVPARVVYEAVEQLEQALAGYEQIVANGLAQAEPGYRVVEQPADLPPPPNPSTVPAWEELRSLRGHQVRTRLASLGYRSVGAARAKQPAQAMRLAGQMRNAANDAQQTVDALERLLAPCTQAVAQKPAAKGKAMRVGMTVGMLGAGGLAAAVLGSRAAASGSSNGSSGPGGGNITLESFTTFVCTGNSCSGTVTLNIPMVMNSGTVIVVSTSGFMGSVSVSRTAAPGRQTFTLTRPYNTCYQTQRELGIWNATTIDAPQTAALTGLNIPVSCQ